MTYIPEPLRRQVIDRASQRCEYCHLHQDNSFFTHEIDHIYAEKHAGETVADNLCLACGDCNRHKGSDLCSVDPLSGVVTTLFHPRRDQWNDHFTLNPNGIIESRTATGRVTERVLRFNDSELVDERAALIAHGNF